MIADLKPYAEYKESGLPWLGRVPGHWEPVKLKHVFKLIVGGSTPASGNPRYWNGDVTWVTPADVSRSERLRRSIRQISRAGMLSCSTEMVPRGSIVLTSRAPVGNVAIAEVNLCTNQGCKALIPDPAVIAPMFGFWLLTVMKAEIQSLSTGTTFSEVSTSRLGSTFGILPPPDEQAAIVRFLDWANGRLERAIRAKRKVIALLNEQKQAIIHRAVTRGLDPSVPLKPSGIPWLGDIPQHWEVRRLGHAIQLQTGFPFASTGFVQGESGVRLLRGINVTPSGIRWKEAVRWQRQDGDGLDEFELAIGDIVLGMDRPIIGSGVRVAFVRDEDTPSLLLQRVARLRPTAILDARFLLLLLRGRLFRDYVAPIFTGISVPHLSPQQIKNFRVPVPSLTEQRMIVNDLEAETSGIITAISRLEREIELLREYRTRLVADVVTGKLDVREAAARLPDEAPLDTIEDDADLTDETEPADEEASVA